MPTYQYACTECGHAFEQVQSFSDDALTVCPACEGKLRKVFNAVGVVFKGSGFYRNDSRAKESSSISVELVGASPTRSPTRSPRAPTASRRRSPGPSPRRRAATRPAKTPATTTSSTSSTAG